MTDTNHEGRPPRRLVEILYVVLYVVGVMAAIAAIVVFLWILCVPDYGSKPKIFTTIRYWICEFFCVVMGVLGSIYVFLRIFYHFSRKIDEWLNKAQPKNSAQPKWVFEKMREMNWISKAEPKGWLKMPELKPVPIATEKHGFTVWLHSVRTWELTENWKYTLPVSCTGGKGVKIVIPKGFVFDGASIPRPFWAILHPSGLLLIPALVHDFAYRCGFLWEITAEKSTDKETFTRTHVRKIEGEIVEKKETIEKETVTENPGEVRRYRHESGCKKDEPGCRKSWDKLFKEIGDEVNGVKGVNWVAWLAVYAFGCSAWKKNDETRKKANCRECLACQCRPPDGYDMEQPDTEQSDCQMNDRPENGGNDLPK